MEEIDPTFLQKTSLSTDEWKGDNRKGSQLDISAVRTSISLQYFHEMVLLVNFRSACTAAPVFARRVWCLMSMALELHVKSAANSSYS